MKYFKDIKSLQELRTVYRELLKKYHPDNGGSESVAKEINAEYEIMFQRLKAGTNNKTDYDTDIDIMIRDVIQKIISLNVHVEICGSWVWVSGNTYPVKDSLKAAGLKYSRNKKMWYFAATGCRRYSKKSTTIDYIRNKYGSQVVKEDRVCIA